MGSAIERFFLYGEPPRDVPADFVHLENLDERSRPGDWNIRAHSHASLAHVFFFVSGGGRMSVDGVATEFVAPALLLIPGRVVHGFTWQPDTQGHVLTLSSAFLARFQAAMPELAGLFGSPAHIALSLELVDAEAIGHTLARLSRELAWSAPARERALEACLTTLLLDALRLHLAASHGAGRPPRANMRLASRYVATVETEFRRPRSMSAYANEFGVEPAALRAATHAVTGRSPSSLLRERKVLEAKRLLLYSNISIKEAAHVLGFEDPAYFSRVFRNATGSSPRSYRKDCARIVGV